MQGFPGFLNQPAAFPDRRAQLGHGSRRANARNQRFAPEHARSLAKLGGMRGHDTRKANAAPRGQAAIRVQSIDRCAPSEGRTLIVAEWRTIARRSSADFLAERSFEYALAERTVSALQRRSRFGDHLNPKNDRIAMTMTTSPTM